GRSGKFLRLGVKEYEGQTDHALRRRRHSRKERPGHDGVVRAEWTGIHRLERRAGVQVHRSRLVRDQLRHAGGDRLLLGETHRWRREGSAMRMGDGQVRTLLASNTGKVLRRMGERSGRAATGDARGVADDEARSRKATEGICRKVTSDLFAIHVPLMQNIPGLRSCYDKVGRLIYFGRMLDKLRLQAADKLPSDYQQYHGEAQFYTLAGRCCRFHGGAQYGIT